MIADRFELPEQVRELMATTFGMDELDVPADVHQGTLQNWTSLNHMLLLAALESHFDVRFSMDEITSLTSLERIVGSLREHLA